MLRRRLAVASIAVLASGTWLAGQSSEPDPDLLIETYGPGGWRSRLGPTNLATLLDSAEARGIWQPAFDTQLANLLRETFGEGFDRDAATKRWIDYDGPIRLAITYDGPARSHGVLQFGTSDAADVVALVDDVRSILESNGIAVWRSEPIDDVSIDVHRERDQAFTAPIPTTTGFEMWFVAGQDLSTARDLAAALRRQPISAEPPRPGSPALTIRYDLASLIAMGNGPFPSASIVPLGLDGLRDLTVAVRSAGPQLAIDVGVEIAGPPRGLVAALMPPRTGVSRLAGLVPEDSPVWSVGRFDCRSAFDALVAALSGDEDPDDVRVGIRDQLGIEPGADLLAHMTDEILVLGAPLEELRSAPETTWLIAFRLKDVDAFRSSLTTLMTNTQGLLVPIETTDVEGVELKTYGNVLRYQLSLAAGHGVFLLAGGIDGEGAATDFLKRAARADIDGAADFDPTARFPYPAHNLPGGLQGLGHADIDSLLVSPGDLWFDLVSELAPSVGLDLDTAVESQERLRELLQRYGLASMHTATGFADGRWRWRLLW